MYFLEYLYLFIAVNEKVCFMIKPNLLDIKDCLTNALNSHDTEEREDLLLKALELMSEVELNHNRVERALRYDRSGDTEKANGLIEETLEALDNEEYEEPPDEEHMHHGTEFDDESVEGELFRSQTRDLDEEGYE